MSRVKEVLYICKPCDKCVNNCKKESCVESAEIICSKYKKK